MIRMQECHLLWFIVINQMIGFYGFGIVSAQIWFAIRSTAFELSLR